MEEIYWNIQKDMLVLEDLSNSSTRRFNDLPRAYFLKHDKNIEAKYPEQYEGLCEEFGSGPGFEYARVYQFSACNFSTKDGSPDIDDDGNYIFESVSCPIRHTCKRGYCNPEMKGPISDREMQVVALFAKGYGEDEIGERLFISRSTVHNHITHIYQKLNFTGKANPDRLLVTYAVKNKII